MAPKQALAFAEKISRKWRYKPLYAADKPKHLLSYPMMLQLIINTITD